jgi:hypothetical protein
LARRLSWLVLDLRPRAEAVLASPASWDAAGRLEAVLADRATLAARAVSSGLCLDLA